MKRISPRVLTKLSHHVLMCMGCDENEADIVSEHLVSANLAGHDSHGIGMLPSYGKMVSSGKLIPNQTPEVVARNGAVTVVDAKRGFGHRMALIALDTAIETVADHRVAILALRNSGHVSRLGRYSEYCASRGYVSIHLANVLGDPPLVAPFGAREPGFSTNPVSMAIPTPSDDGAYVAGPLLDMATSTVAFGKIRVARNAGEEIEKGTLIDREGEGTTDPVPMVDRREGAITAFGSHKGSGLGIFIELLAGAVGGLRTVADEQGAIYSTINSMFSIVIDPASFGDKAGIFNRVNNYSEHIRSRSPLKGVEEVLMPGDPEKISREKRSQSGIPVDGNTLNQIFDTAVKFGSNPSELEAIIA